MELLDIFREEMKKNDDWIRQVITYEDLEKNEAEGKLSALLSVEDGGVSMGRRISWRNTARRGCA